MTWCKPALFKEGVIRAALREWQWWRHRKRLVALKLVVLDVDGVLTDGGLWFGPDGQLLKRFDVRDGLGLRLLQQAGLQLAFLSGGSGGATEVRARQLGIAHCLVGIKDKPAALLALQQRLGVNKNSTAFVGDDLNDLAVRQQVGLLLAPSDACWALRCHADSVLARRGGHGAVRELAERILQARCELEVLTCNGWRERNDP
jgi:3-deoxy-D-manno-octulosonate 8-phosphate phosphatase (KDO 8-P phosphatase)